MQKLQTVNAETLLYEPLEKPSFVVDSLIPTGLSLFCGSQKIGKSWLMLKLCLCVSQGIPLWDMPTMEGDVLYLCLEDTFCRIQDRLFRLTDEASGRLHFAVASCKLSDGLIVQLEDYLKDYPDSRLIVIDTLQKVRTASKDNAYASDYGDISLIFVELARRVNMSLSIQERLKDLRVERGLTLGQLAEQTGLSKSALGSYETEDFKDISHYALIRLAKFYGVTADYLLGLSEMKNHPNADLADLRLSDEMIDLLKSGRIDNTLLCELAAHPDFPRLMADLEIYVNGTALKQAQGANAIVDTMSATVIKKHNPGMSDTQLRQLITAHIDEDEFCRYVIQRDINGIALALRETHKDDFFSVPEDNPLKEMLETAGEIVSQDSDTEQAYLAFICKRLKLNFRKLSVEERKWLKKIAEKSDLLKNPKPQRGRR